LTLTATAALVACGGGSGQQERLSPQGVKEGVSVQKVAGCRGPNDKPEQGLQGQVPIAVRQAPGGFQGYSCNLELVGQLQGEGGNWSSAAYTDGAGRSCAYYATAAPNAARQNPGVPVIDITNSSKPKLIATFNVRTAFGVAPHGLSVSEDGNRMYGVTFGQGRANQPDTLPANNGFIIFDTSEVQQRKPGAQIKVISSTFFRDGSAGQHTIPIKIGGKQHLVMVDEGGSGNMTNACAAGMAPFPMARIYDISDETNPKLVRKLALETHDTQYCDQIIPDLNNGANFFSYGSHYCSVDNRENATALACSYFNSGIRVFDIRQPEKAKEIAYYNPATVPAVPPGSSHGGSWRPGGPDWCTSRLDFDFAKKQLVTMCQDNGLVVLKFGAGTWPFAQSTPSREHN
jgi:hypothetical protein